MNPHEQRNPIIIKRACRWSFKSQENLERKGLGCSHALSKTAVLLLCFDQTLEGQTAEEGPSLLNAPAEIFSNTKRQESRILERHHRIKCSTSEAINALFCMEAWEVKAERIEHKCGVSHPRPSPLPACLLRSAVRCDFCRDLGQFQRGSSQRSTSGGLGSPGPERSRLTGGCSAASDGVVESEDAPWKSWPGLTSPGDGATNLNIYLLPSSALVP